jgi:hypothetical protein
MLIVGTIAFLKFKERWKLSSAIAEAEASAPEPEQHAPEVVAALERPLSSFSLGNFLPPSSQPAASPSAGSFYSPDLAQSVKPANDSGREESSLLPRRRS